MVSLLLLLVAPRSAAKVFDATVAAHSKLKSFSVHIVVSSRIPGKKQETQYDLSVIGKDALIRVREPATDELERTDRRIQVIGNKMIAYDAIANERLTRKINASDSLVSKLHDPLGGLNDAVQLVLSPKAMAHFFAFFKGFDDWSAKRMGDQLSLARSAGQISMFNFSLDKHLVREVMIRQSSASVLHWIFTYGSNVSLALPIPANARRVYSFTVATAPAHFDSAKTKLIAKTMGKAYLGLRNGIIDVSGDEGRSRLWLSGRQLRQESKGCLWAFDGNILTVQNKKSGKFYRGKAIRVVLAEYITKVGGIVDPIIRQIVAHRAPYDELFPTGAHVEWKGSGAVAGIAADILNVTTATNTSSLFVRHDNHMLASMATETFDTPEKVQSRSTRNFTYVELGAPPSSGLFHLSPGSAKVLPLPEIVISPPKPSSVRSR